MGGTGKYLAALGEEVFAFEEEEIIGTDLKFCQQKRPEVSREDRTAKRKRASFGRKRSRRHSNE